MKAVYPFLLTLLSLLWGVQPDAIQPTGNTGQDKVFIASPRNTPTWHAAHSRSAKESLPADTDDDENYLKGEREEDPTDDDPVSGEPSFAWFSTPAHISAMASESLRVPASRWHLRENARYLSNCVFLI